MGRKTWESLPWPLAGRINIVLRHYPYYPPLDPCPALQCCALETALYEAREEFAAPHTFAIGGAAVYAAALEHEALARLFLTEVRYYGEADTLFPSLMIWDEGLLGQWTALWQRSAVSEWVYTSEPYGYRFGIWARKEKDGPLEKNRLQ
jgi:dihydrofolate reductase